MRIKCHIFFLVMILSITGCAGGIMGGQGNVSIGDPTVRTHLKTELTAVDYLAMSENVTNKMLSSSIASSWGTSKPRLIVGDLRNNTDNENIRMSDIHDRITETLVNTGVVRVVDSSATGFDYIIKTDLNTTRQRVSNKELVYFTLQLKLFTIDGEVKGLWSDDLSLEKI